MHAVLRWLVHRFFWCGVPAAVWLIATTADAQLQFTEVMFDPITENVWEWAEVRNTGGAPIDLHGWVFDDDDDGNLGGPNIDRGNGTTILPAGGVAVLYNAADLNYQPARFTATWGEGIPLVPVSSFTQLSAGDAIGLWSSHAVYLGDTIAMPAMNGPRRTFASAAASLNFATASGFPATMNGHSIAWNGNGSPATPGNWVSSVHSVYNAHTSVPTTLPGAQINSTSDRANPGMVPGGDPPAGLRITEIMYDPASAESDWEWVEVLNNTGVPIDFSSTNYVLHDVGGADFTTANITSGNLPQGGVAVLFNAAANSLANMQTAWGSGINFIPVTSWGAGFANSGGDTVAIWSSLANYNMDAPGAGRTTTHAAAVVSYNSGAAAGWPSANNSASIFLKTLNADPTSGGNWVRSGTASDMIGSPEPAPVYQDIVDSPGGDVGSPGFVAGTVVAGVAGDFNGNGVVDTADYVVWRRSFGSGSLSNEGGISPGTVDAADYNFWRSRFGATSGAASGGAANVPEPAGLVLLAVVVASALYSRQRALPT